MRSKPSFVALIALTSLCPHRRRSRRRRRSRQGKVHARRGHQGPVRLSGPLTAKIETTQGTFTCELYEKQTPITVANFVGLARGVRPWKDPKTGQWVKKPYYDGLIFHRVIPGFMIQGGDPLGVGTGNPGYRSRTRFVPELKFDKPGLWRWRTPAPSPTARSSSSPIPSRST